MHQWSLWSFGSFLLDFLNIIGIYIYFPYVSFNIVAYHLRSAYYVSQNSADL